MASLSPEEIDKIKKRIEEEEKEKMKQRIEQEVLSIYSPFVEE